MHIRIINKTSKGPQAFRIKSMSPADQTFLYKASITFGQLLPNSNLSISPNIAPIQQKKKEGPYDAAP